MKEQVRGTRQAHIPPLLLLASASPRRRMLLESLGYRVTVHPSAVDEGRLPQETPVQMALRLADSKARAAPVCRTPEAPAAVIAADTVVHDGHDIFPKPASPEDATRMLMLLAGRWHRVSTAYCVKTADARRLSVVTSRVLFMELGRGTISRYVASGEPLDKAGAYGIQGAGVALVREVVGSYSNVVGLPLHELTNTLAELGVDPP